MYNNRDDGDVIPVRDNSPGKKLQTGGKTENDMKRTAQQRQMITKWTREDLEDKHLRMYEENIILKKHARKQEEKIKRMATKLLRLVSDKKKAEQDTGVKKVRDIETEEMLEELHGKIREKEKENMQLRDKLIVAKQQLATQGTRKSYYGHVQSRIDTGIPKPPPDPRISRSMRVTGPPPQSARAHSPQLPRYGHSLLEEARAENKHLEDVIAQLNEQVNMAEQDIEIMKEQMRVREADFEEDLLKVKQQMSQGQRAAVQENIDIIKLQREVKEKSTKLIQMQGQYGNLDENLRRVKSSHDQVLREMESLNHQLKRREKEVISLQNELKQGTTSQRAMLELQERIGDLERECEILKESNEKLVSSAFDLEREREWRQKENALKVQIAQLEATLRADVGEKGTILDRLSDERDAHENLEEEHKEIRVKYFQVRQELDDLKDKMTFFTKESAVDFQEIEEALMIVKQRKEQQNQELDFLHKVDDEKNKDYEKMVLEMRAEHADTINELEKTRNLLIIQYKLNKDYAQEVGSVTSKMEEERTEYEEKLEEFAQLLDIRATRIRKLEAQLRDVAYGTRQYKLKGEEEEEDSDVEEIDETIHLERGQNLFEIHVKKAMLSPEALRQMGDEEPNTFCTWEFYEYEIQSTPVLKGPKPGFAFTSQYLVQVDDFFLHYLQKDSCTLEMHQSYGTDYRTVAACQLRLRDILDQTRGKLHGSAQLIGVNNGTPGINYGVVEFWARWKVPMDQALRLYKERSKALGYLESNIRTTEQALTALDESAAQRPPDNVNQLTIKIKCCSGIQARRDDLQPSPYCVYKFFDYDDHDTTIIPGSNNPQFNDHKTFPVPMTADLDKYIKSQPLKVYVFDDTDPAETAYLGLAKIELLPLAHDKAIRGIFELRRMDGAVNGTVEVSMKWTYTYLPPRYSTKTSAQLQATGTEPPERLSLLPGEDAAMRQSVVAGAPGTAPTPTTPSSRPPRPPGPQAVSTPVARKSYHTAGGAPVVSEASPPDAASAPGHYPDDSGRQSFGPITEEPEGSVISEGTPVPGESEPVSEESDSEDITPSSLEVTGSAAPPSVGQVPQGSILPTVQVISASSSDGGDDENGGVQDAGTSQDTRILLLPNPEALQESLPRPKIPVPTPRKSRYSDASIDGSQTWPLPSYRSLLIESTSPKKKKKKPSWFTAKHRAQPIREKTEDELIAEELGEGPPAEDTMFEEERPPSGVSDEEENTLTEGEDLGTNRSDDTGAETEDSEAIIVQPSSSRPQSQLVALPPSDNATISVNHLTLNEEAAATQDDAVKMLFVEYRFLNAPLEETETPYSLPKPEPHRQISFNFAKIFHLDYENNYERRQLLASMLLDDAPDDGRVCFTVVSEPDEDSGDECEDIGHAFVNVKDILQTGKDVIEEDIPIYDVERGETEIGHLNLTVKCLDALRVVEQEMKSPEAAM